MTKDWRDNGRRTRREVLGDEHVDRAEASTTAFSAPFQDYITWAAWGGVWSRRGLDRRTRSAVTLAVLTAIGAEAELPMHVRAALRHGLTPMEIAEVLLQAGLYAGVPRANAAFAVAQQTLADDGVAEAQPGSAAPANAEDSTEQPESETNQDRGGEGP